MISLLLFIYVIVWPFILPLLCIGGVALAKRPDLLKVVVRFAVLIAASTIPLLVEITNSADHDLPLASLMLYPVAVVCLAVTASARLLLIWMKKA